MKMNDQKGFSLHSSIKRLRRRSSSTESESPKPGGGSDSGWKMPGSARSSRSVSLSTGRRMSGFNPFHSMHGSPTKRAGGSGAGGEESKGWEGMLDLGGNLLHKASLEMNKLGGFLRRKDEEDKHHGSQLSLAELNRIDQEKRERMRDQGTEDSPYLDDAKVLLKTQWDAKKRETYENLERLSFCCWLGGKPVQDLISKSNFFEAISDILQGRISSPTFDGNLVESGNNKDTERSSTFGRLNTTELQQPEDQDPRVNRKMAIAVLRALAAACRDHISNQRFAFSTGMVIELVEFILVPEISPTEKRWAIHNLFILLLPCSEAQEIVLQCAYTEELNVVTESLSHDRDWKTWPVNECTLLRQLLGWEPLSLS